VLRITPLERQAAAILDAHRLQLYQRTDRMFAGLMLLQWAAGVAAACWISPLTWAGSQFATHPHVSFALLGGGALASLPVILATIAPGRLLTRYVISIAQVLFSGLLIHVTGGRIETHFHVFGSLAFLAFYRDWRLLVPATVIVAADHFLRGMFWPQSVYGVIATSSWRWLEHAGWVIFEDFFLFISCQQATREMQNIALRTAELEQAQQSEHAIIEAALDAVVQMDLEGRVTGWNSQAVDTFGWSADEAVGALLADLIIPPRYREAHRQDLHRFCRTGEGAFVGQRIEIVALRRDRREFPVELGITVVQTGEELGFCAFVNDITKRREAEEAQKQAKEAAEAANRAKSEFLANMSHEIRTPLNSILGFSDLLLRGADGGDEAERLDFVRTIQTSSHHLLTLLNDVLDLSKIEAGQLDVELSRCSPSQLLAEVVSVLRVRAIEKQLCLEYTWSGAIPETIESDPARFRQVLMNLIGNAVKFTRQGYVRITARVDREPAEPLLVIDVEDSGIGIPAENCERIFSPFEQADSSVTREFGGTGLGLSISRRLVEMMRGRISVRSEPGRGSTFTIAIPTGPLENVRFLEAHSLAGDRGDVIGQESQVVTLPPARILLVDDGQTNRKLIGLILKRAGCTVETADNGRTALDLALTSQYDLVLMDMQMPIMDGYVATRLLRERGYQAPIVALTAHALLGDEQKCLAAGCTAYLSKPIDSQRLLAKMARVLTEHPPGTAAMPTVAPDARPQLHSTLPVDDPDFLEIVVEFVDTFRSSVAGIDEALGISDYNRIAELAHALKGTGGTAGFPDISHAAGKLERALQATDLDSVELLIADLKELSDRIVIREPSKSLCAAADHAANDRGQLTHTRENQPC